MREITKEQAEQLCYKADAEGLDYAILNGYMDAPGTILEDPVNRANGALTEINTIINELKEKYDIEDA